RPRPRTAAAAAIPRRRARPKAIRGAREDGRTRSRPRAPIRRRGARGVRRSALRRERGAAGLAALDGWEGATASALLARTLRAARRSARTGTYHLRSVIQVTGFHDCRAAESKVCLCAPAPCDRVPLEW